MARTKKEKTKVEETNEVSEPKEEVVEIKKKDATESVDIIKNKKLYVRSYSRVVHGDDFLKLAEEFKSKFVSHDIAIVDSSTIPAVSVNYREKEDAELHLDKQDPDAPFVDKVRVFTDKEEALRFNNAKKGTISIKVK